MSKLNVDTYGHCVVCHKRMLIESIIDNKPQFRFTPEYTDMEYLLDDGSKMRVALCVSCKQSLTHSKEEQDRIMNCVIAGWQAEVDGLKDWDDSKRKKHMDKYGNLKIVVNSQGKPDDMLQDHLDKFHGQGKYTKKNKETGNGNNS